MENIYKYVYTKYEHLHEKNYSNHAESHEGGHHHQCIPDKIWIATLRIAYLMAFLYSWHHMIAMITTMLALTNITTMLHSPTKDDMEENGKSSRPAADRGMDHLATALKMKILMYVY